MQKRRCGDCQLCCKLLPVQELHKPSTVRCQHQRFKKGCAIYAKRPHSCRIWSCQWLTNPATSELKRPDMSHYVIDSTLDYVTLSEKTGEAHKIPAVQVWIDPKFPKSHNDPALRRYLDEMGEKGIVSLLRFNSGDAITLFPPSMISDKQWHEVSNCQQEAEHTAKELVDTLGKAVFL